MRRFVTKAKIYTIDDESEMTSYDSGHEYILYFDGGSRGNPGPGGSGYVLYENEKEIACGHCAINTCTNNFAEYKALILGLKYIIKRGNIDKLIIRGDSLLVINQCKGLWKIKSESLRPLHAKAMHNIDLLKNVTFEHVKRNLNKRADELANIAMDSHFSPLNKINFKNENIIDSDDESE